MTIPDSEARDCYYVLRAMHDGACAKCGKTHSPAEVEKDNGDLVCPDCQFTVTREEVRGIEAVSSAALKRRYESFMTNRETLKELGK